MSTTTNWSGRSRTQATMLNPALMAAITANAALQYSYNSNHRMPWSLSFVVAPLVLHRATREALPRGVNTHLGAWVSEHPVEHAGFARRAMSLKAPVQEGVRFGLTSGMLQVDPEGRLTAALASGAGHSLDPDSEVQRIVSKAGFVGKWFTKLDEPATIFALLGVAP